MPHDGNANHPLIVPVFFFPKNTYLQLSYLYSLNYERFQVVSEVFLNLQIKTEEISPNTATEKNCSN